MYPGGAGYRRVGHRDRIGMSPATRMITSLHMASKVRRVDPCIGPIIRWLNDMGFETLACCCGHGKYHPTIIVQRGDQVVELLSGRILKRTRNFYKRDSDGIYHVPEVEYIAVSRHVH